MTDYQKLKVIFKRLSHLQYIQRIMQWDEAVMMPEGAGATRADALSTLARTSQKLLTHKKIKTYIEQAKLENHPNLWDQANIQWMEKKYITAISVPIKLTAQLTKTSMESERAWRKLRSENNWQAFLPYLKKTFQLVKEIAEIRSQVLNIKPYDVYLEDYAPGFTQQKIDEIFRGLKQNLPALIQKIVNKQSTDSIIPLKGPFSIDQQNKLGLQVMRDLQFDFQHGRLDVSHHPFCSGGPTDVRMTTRYSANEFISALLGVCHETGHALYEQGLPRAWINQPVGHIDSMAMHESQSLLIEMQVCRSLPFLEYLHPLIQTEFGNQDAFAIQNLFKILTRVKSSLIRVDADQVTYPLHIILRYEIEKMLFNDEIKIEELPECWDEMMKKYLNISTKDNYKDGVMQDVHWPAGAFGYFPAYSLGRLIASQFFATFAKEHPDYKIHFQQGNFGVLRNWLKINIHSHASSLPTENLLQNVTGKNLDPNYFLGFIKTAYEC